MGYRHFLGNLKPSVFGELAYLSIKAQARHLLYFTIKPPHLLAAIKEVEYFLWFLYKNNRLLNDKGELIINNTGLTALFLLIVKSEPKQKDMLI